MSKFIHKSHNVSVLMYHIVCPAKYRRVVFSEAVDQQLKETCLEISKRYEITFLEIGTDQDHVHFLVQSVPTYSPRRVVQIIKSITAREILRACPEVKKKLWGGEFWTDGYFKHGRQARERGRDKTVHPESGGGVALRAPLRGAAQPLLIPRSLLRASFIQNPDLPVERD